MGKQIYKKIYIPWFLDGYVNGNHPLINSYLIYIKKNFELCFEEAAINYQSVNDFIKIKLNHIKLSKNDNFLTSSLIEYISSKNNLSCLYQPINSVALHHSIMPCASLPSIIHFETPITFFIPFLQHGKFVRGFSLRNHFIYSYIFNNLSNTNVKFIFTHSYMGYKNFKILFPDAILHKKLHYISAKPFVYDFIETYRSIFYKIRFFNIPKKINVLFTSSFHSGNNTFWLRGGAIALNAFSNICNNHSVSLNFVGKIPNNVLNEFKFILKNPDIKTYEFLSDFELQKLYDKSHILLSPTVGLHAMSLLRAVCSNLFVISSNAPGVSDFIENDSQGIILDCKLMDEIYFPDLPTPILLDDYSKIHEFNRENTLIFSNALNKALLTISYHKKEFNPIDNSPKEYLKSCLMKALTN